MKVDGIEVSTLTDLAEELIAQTIKEKNLGLTPFEQRSLIDGIAAKLSRCGVDDMCAECGELSGLSLLASSYSSSGR